MRKHKTASEMFPLIEEWASSGQTQQGFCKSRGLFQSVFNYWRKKYLDAQNSEPTPFKELHPDLATKIEICYPNGVKIQLPAGSSLSTLQTLIGLI